MLILVANLGSTSFKYKLLDVSGDLQAVDVRPGDRVLARGAVERIGDASTSRCEVTIGDYHNESEMPVPDHGVAVQACLDQLTDPQNGCLKDASEVSAIGFKAVHGGRKSGTFLVDDDVLDAMAEMNAAAPAHNPPYIAAMKLLRERFPELPLVAAFETEFHDTIPEARRVYAIPPSWRQEYQVQKWGFHGSSHRFIAERAAELLGRDDARIISCHLGGSSSLTAIQNGQSVMTTMGMTPQTGLPQNNRVGDFDPFALPLLIERSGQSLEELLKLLASEGGLKGLSELSGDLRDIEAAADEGNEKAKLALSVFVEEIRRHMGGMMIAMGGLDAIVFTGGIGENSEVVREAVCAGLDSFGIQLDSDQNQNHRAESKSAGGEGSLHSESSRVQVWVIPTNEEWIVAKRAKKAIGC
ncbi:acetate/propionate family kinase [Aporhodopirellula aestuarii]|uniref:Acetate kinase n=1 Tax=Aporhodopirellula aestuarii TaxID=2950107 RepID=A0ABT0TY58_9BACT|nr:acetate/propionate family kinase [Aporhodopirellula aestuarii]MCM2369532.1 acetate/propionate family kinase [Aporhodopirellula aestuarii]